jgi:predicted DNA-binding protein (UPF0251 family)
MLIICVEVLLMPRPPCCRRVSGKPAAAIFKPAGIPARVLEEVVMTLDEFEAIRLADFEGLYQEQAAERMRVSRPTFGRIVEIARRKVAEAIILGKALKIEGGPVQAVSYLPLRCPACKSEWDEPPNPPTGCPYCHRGEITEAREGSPACGGRRRRWMSFKNT